MILPPPQAFGLPAQFGSWYPHQDATLSWILDHLSSGPRFTVVAAPTGSGKSLLAVLSGTLSGRRTAIITATKALQDQYRDTLGCLDVADIRGQNAYLCTYDQSLSAEDGPCHAGVPCQFKSSASGCPYFEALSHARNPATRVVVTNYACWMIHNQHQGLGKFDLLVLDEAHQAHDCLGGFLEVGIREDEVSPIGLSMPTHTDVGKWRDWAGACWPRVESYADSLKEDVRARREGGQSIAGALTRAVRRGSSLVQRLKQVARMQGEWIVERAGWHVSLSPVWPTSYADPVLFCGVPSVLMLSATIRPKTVNLLGVEEFSFQEVPSTFPASHRPVVHVPTAKMNHRATDYDVSLWAARIDQIMEGRMDRKGIVHTVSYRRRDQLLKLSRNRQLMVSHATRDLGSAVARFRNMDPPAVMVSPSLYAGFDFPYSECEFIVVGKVPYPDTRSPVVKARQRIDPDWPAYHAMQTLVQAAGRGVRSADDRCETLVVDDDWTWFWKRYRDFAPQWFREAVRFERSIPAPLGRLAPFPH